MWRALCGGATTCENLVGNVGIGFVFGLVTFGWLLIAVGLFVLALQAKSTLAIAATVAAEP